MKTATNSTQANLDKLIAEAKKLTTAQVCEGYEAIHASGDASLNIAKAAMSEVLMERDADAYERWSNTEDPDLFFAPSSFFAATA
jgi:hypothetical protein